MLNKGLAILFASAAISFGLAQSAQAQEDPYAPIIVPASAQTSTAAPSNDMNPNISLVGTMLGVYNGAETPPPGSEATRFGLQEIELGFQAAVDPYFRVDAFLAMPEGGPEIVAEQLELTTLGLPAGFQVKLGQLLPSLGRHNTRHLETWDFVDTHLTHQLLLDGGLSTPGVELSYLIPTGSRTLMLKVFAEALYAGGDSISALRTDELAAALGAAPAETFDYDDLPLAPLARLEAAITASPSFTAIVGGSFLTAPSGRDGMTPDSRIYGADLYLRYRDTSGEGYNTLSLTAEGFRRERKIDERDFVDHGVYTQVFWRFAKRWQSALRGEWVDGDSFNQSLRASASLSFLPTEFSRLRIQYNAHKMEDMDLGHTALVQIEFSIGPHGAHTF